MSAPSRLRALVTGGSHGIGFATAMALVQHRASKVVITGRNEARLEAAKRTLLGELDSDGKVLAIPCDALEADSPEWLWQEIEEELGGIDVLVNNVGGGGRWTQSEAAPGKVYEEVMRKNFFHAAILVARALPGMRQRNWGRIVTISSIHGLEAGGQPWFAAAKAAQVAASKAWALEPANARHGITSNIVAPGTLEVPGTGSDRFVGEERRLVLDKLSLGRFGTSEEVARVVAWLVEEGSAYVNGATIVVDGGESRYW